MIHFKTTFSKVSGSKIPDVNSKTGASDILTSEMREAVILEACEGALAMVF
ncbi:MAG: hypothetical protein WDA08_11825 [Weeksellaceae bacterium]